MKDDITGQFGIRHTQRCSLDIPEHRVNDIGLDNYLSEIQSLIDNSNQISADIKANLKADPTSSYYIINVSKLVTKNIKTGQICEWRPTETMTGTFDRIVVLVLAAVDGEKLEDVPVARKADCWGAVGNIAVKACHMISKPTQIVQCALLPAAKAKKI